MPLRALWIGVVLLGWMGVVAEAQSAAASNDQEKSSVATSAPVEQDAAASAAGSDSSSQAPSADSQSSAKTSQKKQTEDSSAEKKKFGWRLGTVSVGAGNSHFSGPYYPYGYPYWYSPLAYNPGDWIGAGVWYPLWGPFPLYGPDSFAYNDGRGELRLTAEPKTAEVYIDGGYAGTADKLKTMWLDPGAYDLTVAAADHEDFHQRVYVLSRKALKITANLNADSKKEKP